MEYSDNVYKIKINQHGVIGLYEQDELLWAGSLADLIYKLGEADFPGNNALGVTSLMKQAIQKANQQFDRERLKNKGWE